MVRRRQIYEGKAKILYEGPEPGTLIQYFKDDATAFNAQKRGTISGKGVLNNRISEHIFTALADDRRPDPLHPPPQHARATDPPGRDRADRGGRPQRRRRLAVEAPRDRGRHPAAAHDHRILLQGRRARRSDDRRRAYRLLRLGQPGRDERHRRHGDPGERLHVRHVRGDRHPPGRLQAGVRPGLGRRLCPHHPRRRDQPRRLPAVGHEVEREARQGPLPPEPRRRGRGLSGSRPPPRPAARGRRGKLRCSTSTATARSGGTLAPSCGALPRVRVVTLNAALGPLDYRVPDGMARRAGQRSSSRRSARASCSASPGRRSGCRPRKSATTACARWPAWSTCRRSPRRCAASPNGPPTIISRPLAAVLRMVLPSSSALAGPRQMIEYRPTGLVPDRLTPQREQALAAIEGRQGTVRELAAHAEVSDAVMRGLVNAGALEAVEVDGDRPLPDARPRLRAARAQRRAARGRGQPDRARSARASTRSCSTASPDRARPKSISRRSPRRCGRASRRSSCSPRSR